jgi:RNA polymerase sigma-70 factor (ECF subfamily)
LTDEELMSAYAGGDRAAFTVLFRRWAPRLHAFFLRSVREAATAEDLLQVTFLKVHRARASFNPLLRLRAWVYAIAVRELAEELRRRQRTPLASKKEQDDTEHRPASDDAARSLDEQRRSSAIRAAIERLPDSQRTVLYLHRYEEMSFAEIAHALGLTEGAVKLRAFRAYERLREELAFLLDEERAA